MTILYYFNNKKNYLTFKDDDKVNKKTKLQLYFKRSDYEKH